jgi:hypothetical protein
MKVLCVQEREKKTPIRFSKRVQRDTNMASNASATGRILSQRGEGYIPDSSLMITGWNRWNANPHSPEVRLTMMFTRS